MEVLSGLSRSGHLEHVRGSGCYNFVSQCLQCKPCNHAEKHFISISKYVWTIQTRKRQLSVMFLGYVLVSFAPNCVSLPERLRLCNTKFKITVFFGYHFNCHQRKRLWKPYLIQVKWNSPCSSCSTCNVHMPQNHKSDSLQIPQRDIAKALHQYPLVIDSRKMHHVVNLVI